MISTYNHLKKFAASRNVVIDFNDINWSFRENFLNYLYEAPRNHSQNTAAKYIQNLMFFMKEAADLLYHYLILLKAKGCSFTEIENVLKERSG